MKRTFLALFAIVLAVCAFAQQTEKTDANQASPVEGVDYVDLGLPSGTKWATCNLGATEPEEYGDYYGWGCLEPYRSKNEVGWEQYFQKLGGTGKAQSVCGTENDPLRDFVAPNKHISGTKWDAARAQLGGKWRIPKQKELEELMDGRNCKWEDTQLNGVKGCKVTSKKNGKSIFLPFCGVLSSNGTIYVGNFGNLWSATPKGEAIVFNIRYGCLAERDSHGRTWGLAIRPVFK